MLLMWELLAQVGQALGRDLIHFRRAVGRAGQAARSALRGVAFLSGAALVAVASAMVYGTDGAISSVGLVVLEDDKSVQPVYQPAPLVREEVLKAHPQIAEVLAPIFASLDLTTLQELNGRIQVGGEPADAVAKDYLTSKGFLK